MAKIDGMNKLIAIESLGVQIEGPKSSPFSYF
jgi:hypothetical protein